LNADLALWYSARIAALAAFVAVSIALLTGTAIRTAFLGGLARNKALLAVHSFMSWLWVPLIAVHVASLLLDQTAKVALIDLLLPFQSQIPGGKVAVGLGTIAFLLLIFIGITSALRRRMSQGLWLWLHRLTYPMFALMVIHAQLAGTDFSRTAISIAGWAVLGLLGALAGLRVIGARVEIVPATPRK
jgi:methionine sulfoxide reductase heme-binding subunit